MAELKVGDKVRVRVPDDSDEVPHGMRVFPGDTFLGVIARESDGLGDLKISRPTGDCWALPEWCELVELKDAVNHPAHYNTHGVEVIDIIESRYADNYHLANAVKYLLRAPYKGAMIEDIRKCQWYINRWLERQ